MPVPVSTSVQSFTQGWLGQFTSDPTLDGYGNPVVAGAMYYNTQSNTIRIYGGTSWAVYNPGLATAAANSATLAQTYATNALNSQTQSAQYATNSANSASAAAASATSAASSATSAAASAAAAENVESAINGIVTISLSNSNVNLSLTQFNNAIIIFTGVLTANILVNVPISQPHTFVAANNTSGAFTVTIGMTGGSQSVTVPQGKANSCFSDGVTGVYATSSVSGLQFSGVTVVSTTGTILTSTAAGTRTALTASGMTTTLPQGSTLQSGASIFVDNQTSGQQTIDPYSGNSIDIGIVVMNAYDKFLFSWDGTEWRTALYSNYINPIFETGLGVAGGTITVTNTTNGNILKMTGTGGTTPSKTIAAVSGNLEILNNAGSTAIITISDIGNLQAAGGMDNTPIGATTPKSVNATTLTASGGAAISGNSTITGNFGVTGNFTLTGLQSNTDTTNSISTLQLTNTGSNGASIELIGNGGTTPNKYLRVQSGIFNVFNSSNTTSILQLTDAGALTTINNIGAGGNITLTSTGTFITGDMTNTTIANRVFLQSNTANGLTSVGALPNGTSTQSNFTAYNTVPPTNSGYMAIGISSVASTLNSAITGSGTLLPMTFQMNSVEYFRLTTTGQTLFGLTTGDGTSVVEINGQLSLPASGLGIKFQDGTTQITANGTTAPTSTVYSVANGNVTLGATSIVTGGYQTPFVQVFNGGLRLINGVDWTYAGDSKTITLTKAISNADQFEVLTNVIYTPSTAYQPVSYFFTPAQGATSITVSYTVGFVSLYVNGSRWEITNDYTATTGTSITFLNGYTADGVSTFEVVALTPMTYANTVQYNNPILGGALTFSDGSSQGTAVSGRNRIINGSCEIQQRAALSIASGSSGYGAVDRFKLSNSGTGGTVALEASTITYNNIAYPSVAVGISTAVTSIASSNFLTGIWQVIEGINCFDLIGLPLALQFVFQASTIGTYSVSLTDSTSAHSYTTTFNYTTSGVPQLFEFQIPAIPTTAVIPESNAVGLNLLIGGLNTGTYQCPSGSLNSWQAVDYISASGAVNWAASTSSYISATNIQLEQGGNCTPFERQKYSDIFAQCMRYYQVGNAWGNGYTTASGQGIGVSAVLQGGMRTSPTMVITTGSTTGVAPAYTSFALTATGSFNIAVNATSTGAGLFNLNITFTASAEL
jgi:hypothetical protein